MGIADGVGSWAEMGVDPSEFSNELMRTAKEAVSRALNQVWLACELSVHSDKQEEAS